MVVMMSQENPITFGDAISAPHSESTQESPPDAKSTAPKTRASTRYNLSHIKASLWLYGIITGISVIIAYVYLYKKGILPYWVGDVASSLSTFNGLIGGLISGSLVTLVGKSSLRYFLRILKNANKPLAIFLSICTVSTLVVVPVVIHINQVDPYIQKGRLDNTSLRFSAHSWYGSGASCSEQDPFNMSQISLSGEALCFAQDSDYNNFIYEVKMIVLDGECGGILLRADSTFLMGYLFTVCPNETGSGFYKFERYDKEKNDPAILRARFPSTRIRVGTGVENTLAVQAEGNNFVLYINQRVVDHVHDNSSDASTGHQIGVGASGSARSTDVQFNDLHVWVL